MRGEEEEEEEAPLSRHFAKETGGKGEEKEDPSVIRGSWLLQRQLFLIRGRQRREGWINLLLLLRARQRKLCRQVLFKMSLQEVCSQEESKIAPFWKTRISSCSVKAPGASVKSTVRCRGGVGSPRGWCLLGRVLLLPFLLPGAKEDGADPFSVSCVTSAFFRSSEGIGHRWARTFLIAL